jgi:hypothetical protein
MPIQSLVSRGKKWLILVLILALVVMPVIGNTSCESGLPIYLLVGAAVCGIQVYQDGNYQGTLEFAKEWGYCMLQFLTTEGIHTLQFVVPGSAVAATSHLEQMTQTAGKVPGIKVTYEGPLVDGGHYNISFGQDSSPREGQLAQVAQQSQDRTITVEASRHPFKPPPTSSSPQPPASLQTYTLSISISPSDGGTISPAGGQYSSGTQITLTATPAAGYTFGQWGGSASGSSSTTTITMNSDKNVIANFISVTSPPLPAPSSNQPPVISSLVAQNQQLSPSGNTEIQCVAQDADGDQLDYTWVCNSGSFSGAGPIVIWEAPPDYGTYTISVTVDDTKGGSAQANLPITIGANQPPVISSLDASPSEILYGGSTTLTCIATDPDGDVVRYSWSASEGSITGVGNKVTWIAPTNKAGEYDITVILSDGKGGETGGSVVVTAGAQREHQIVTFDLVVPEGQSYVERSYPIYLTSGQTLHVVFNVLEGDGKWNGNISPPGGCPLGVCGFCGKTFGQEYWVELTPAERYQYFKETMDEIKGEGNYELSIYSYDATTNAKVKVEYWIED